MRAMISSQELEDLLMELENTAVEADQGREDFEENLICGGIASGIRFSANLLEEILRKPL